MTRLEELKEVIKSTHSLQMYFTYTDLKWLIEQAEKAERYKNALEEIAYQVPLKEEGESYEDTVYKFIDISKRALGY